MRHFLLTITVALAATTARAADDAKPNTLTPKEIADGWILLWDGETTFGWTTPTDSKWTIAKGMIAPQAGKPGLLVTTTAFADYQLSVEYRVGQGGDHNLLIGCAADGNSDKPNDKVGLNSVSPSWWRVELKVKGSRVVDQSYQTADGSMVVKKKVKPKEEPSPRTEPGHIALSGNGIIYRNIKLKPLNDKLLFNGKDLTGWKEFPGKKSKFTVTKEGWLNLKNGPGDLQTTGLYDDFILQLDCISNGKHLNSGVFFRCQPDKYQQGYEAQIHNGFTAEPKKEYAIEVYDRKTNKLTETKKVKNAAIDYGTGGIYRRMPARKEVAKDHEWFTMTVAAHGRHMSVWVNGIQVTDWTDNRPLKDNARNGCRLEKGAISLQGHDPTTDLSFRNIRIAELPKK
jgi:hypothetical protein